MNVRANKFRFYRYGVDWRNRAIRADGLELSRGNLTYSAQSDARQWCRKSWSETKICWAQISGFPPHGFHFWLGKIWNWSNTNKSATEAIRKSTHAHILRELIYDLTRDSTADISCVLFVRRNDGAGAGLTPIPKHWGRRAVVSPGKGISNPKKG